MARSRRVTSGLALAIDEARPRWCRIFGRESVIDEGDAALADLNEIQELAELADASLHTAMTALGELGIEARQFRVTVNHYHNRGRRWRVLPGGCTDDGPDDPAALAA